MKRSEIVNEVRILLRETDSTDSTFTDTEVHDNINRVMPRIAAEIEELLTWQDYTTADGTQRYSLPSDYLKVAGADLIIDSNRTEKLIYVTHKKFLQVSYNASAQKGIPVYYKIEMGAVSNANASQLPGDFWLYPIPDTNGGSNYTVRFRYYQKPDDLTGDTQVPELPLNMHMSIAYKVASMLALKKGETALSNYLEQLFRDDMNAAREYYGALQRDRAAYTPDDEGYTSTRW